MSRETSRVQSDIDGLEAAIRRGISLSADSGRPEAILREHVEPALAEVLRGRGVRSRARDEFWLVVPSTANAAVLDAPLDTRGRADAIYNRFVIEFEPPGSLRPSIQHSATRHAVTQVQQYLRGLAAETGLSMERLAGCAFDGFWIVYVMWERGGWREMRPVRVEPASLMPLVDTLESLATGRGLTTDNLYEDFGPENDVACMAIRALYRIFDPGPPSGRTLAMFGQWQLDLGNASGPFSNSDLREWGELCELLGVPDAVVAAPRVLFCLQTYYALVSKLVALIILEGATQSTLLVDELRSPNIREGFHRLESGALAGVIGATNLIEPGVFSWYVGERLDELDRALETMVTRASEYSAEIVEITPLVVRDVLKNLYQRLLPGSIRHRLGEFYTPDWLAQRVVNGATGSADRLEPSRRVLDPACGSGTFLVEVISRMIRTAANRDPRRTLHQILENVVGFDLSPLAVQASKVNYMLALSPLLRYADPEELITIPVFLADSVSPPRRAGLLEGDVYRFDTSEGPWRLPSVLAESHYLPTLGRLLQEGLTNATEHNEQWFREELPKRIPLVEGRDTRVLDGAANLYSKLRDLHSANRNGMWWRMITNAFAPALQPQFDYIVGNPPWVSWETLPEPYRRANDDLWLAYGLRPDAPLNRRQASANVRLDISMLFVARCLDAFLKDDGRLSFVITASVFQSELAGRGFRRRRLGQDRTYRLVHLDDMSDLNVFEDATNIASVFVADRNGHADNRIPVLRWTGITTKTIPADLELPAVMDLTTRREYYAEPADPLDDASPLLMMAHAGLEASTGIRRRSPYVDLIREGINTRGANGIFFVEVVATSGEFVRVRNIPEGGRNRNVQRLEGPVERGAIRRLLRGEDVSRGQAHPSGWILWFHDAEHVSIPMSPAEAANRLPLAFQFARQFERLLTQRKPFRAFNPTGDNWLALYSVTTAALAPHKVVVREIASGMIAAAVHDSDIIPDHKLYVIPCGSYQEANRLSEVLNCRVVDYMVRSFSISTSITSSFLRYIGIRNLSDVPTDLHGDDLLAYALGLDMDEFRALDQIAAAELPALYRAETPNKSAGGSEPKESI